MEDQNCTVTLSPNSKQTEPPMSLVLEQEKTDTDTVPVVMGRVGVESALNSDVGGKSEAVGSEVEVKRGRGRGRPRKYDINGNLLSPASAPSGFSTYPFGSTGKRGRGRPRGSGKLQLLASMGGFVADTAGGSLTPHVMTVNTGEDVVSKMLLFSQSRPRAVCILSATGAVSNVIIRQPNAGGILRYEGRFDIISLSGSFTYGGVGSAHRKTGIMSVSLAKPDGKVFGGCVEGSMIAAGPIQLIVGSFKQNISREIKRISDGSPSAANIPGNTDSARVPKMIEGEQSFPSPTSGLMPTSNGLPDNVMPGTSNGLPDNVTSATTNGVPDNFYSANQNMHSVSFNGVGLDQITFADVDNSVPHM